MDVRAITAFLDPGFPLQPERVAEMAACMRIMREALQEMSYEVQSLRLATPSPSEMENKIPPANLAEFARQIEAECFVHGVDYVALGPIRPGDEDGFAVLPDVLDATGSVFSTGLFADIKNGLSLQAAKACAKVIHTTASLRPDGFTNLRFAALANVYPGSPFFPAAYHGRGEPAIALAVEGAALAVEAMQDASSLSAVRRQLINRVEAHAATLTRVAQPIAAEHEISFLGIDFSLAPFPEQQRSLGSALEAFGVPASGLAGTIAAASVLAECLDQAQFQRTGFCGLFFPVLEDAGLAMGAAQGSLTIRDLLLCATVCGAGLDTVPIPGDVSVEQIMALLIDLGALALRHDKPLTARLMPIPGKAVGDEVHFDFPYFADTRVMAVHAQPLQGLLSGSGVLRIGPHRV
ncbi:MAG: DUF711 family protein [Anaerolineales bacterium]